MLKWDSDEDNEKPSPHCGVGWLLGVVDLCHCEGLCACPEGCGVEEVLPCAPVAVDDLGRMTVTCSFPWSTGFLGFPGRSPAPQPSSPWF